MRLSSASRVQIESAVANQHETHHNRSREYRDSSWWMCDEGQILMKQPDQRENEKLNSSQNCLGVKHGMRNGKIWGRRFDGRLRRPGSRRRQIGNGDDNHASQMMCESNDIVEANVSGYFHHRPVNGLLQRHHFSSMVMVTSRELHNLVP